MQQTTLQDRTAPGLKKNLGIAGAVAGLTLLASAAQAAPLNLVLAPVPDIRAANVIVAYDSFTDTLTASGSPIEYRDGVPPEPEQFLPSSFALTATINGSGVASAANFNVFGTVGGVSTLLLSGNPSTAFGFNSNGVLEFLFTVNGGSLASAYGGVGSQAAMIMSRSGFTGDWNQDFDSQLSDVDIGKQVPAPATLPLLVAGLGVLFGLRRRETQA
jgi:hypothetical protein